MLVEWMLKLCTILFDLIFSLLGVLPQFSPEIISTIDEYFEFIFGGGIALLAIFVDIDMVQILAPFVIGIINFDHIAKIVMFILKKIPLLSIE